MRFELRRSIVKATRKPRFGLETLAIDRSSRCMQRPLDHRCTVFQKMARVNPLCRQTHPMSDRGNGAHRQSSERRNRDDD